MADAQAGVDWICALRFVVMALLLTGCGSRSGLLPGEGAGACADAGATRACQNACGSGTETCVDGVWQGCTAPKPKSGTVPELIGTLRDFRADHPDFEQGIIASDPGIVAPDLGPDGKPVYAAATTTATTHGKAAFDQWYRDVPDVNISRATALPLKAVKGAVGLFDYTDETYFPIDGQGFGNEGRPHNYHFTLEIVASFQYVGGENFSFVGDDDLWVFINRRLAIDRGGVHGAQAGTVSLDAQQSYLGLTVGQTYPLHFFFAERQTTESSFHLRTSISTFLICE